MPNKIILLIFCLVCFITEIFPQNESKKGDNIKHEKKVSVAGIPKISYNRSSGFGFGVMGMLLFKTDTSSATPKSHVMISGSYTTNKSWYAMGIFQLYLFKDRLRISTGGGYTNFHFQTYYDTDGTSDVEIPYVRSGYFFFVNPMAKAFNHFYVGPMLGLSNSKVNFELPDSTTQTQNYKLNSLGAIVNYDNRSNVYYPTSGFYAMTNFSASPEWFQNDSAFSKLSVNVNYYYGFRNKKMVLASRFAAKVSFGDVPFVGENVVGGKDLRGYTNGEYRGDQAYALQTEFRWTFYKRLGLVGFGGLALEVGQDKKVSPLLPSLGAGLRFLLLPKDNLTIGIDGAVGRGDWGVYFRIGEAF